ncbi:hypothetical protein OE88DRAFT_1679715, partial [Heliocybe sulcata]
MEDNNNERIRNNVRNEQYANLEQHRATIESIKQVTYDYGTTDAHKAWSSTEP